MFALAAEVAHNVAPWWWPTETVQLAIIAGGGGVASAFIMALVAYWVSSRQKREDWKRQDEVAARAAEVARLLLHTNNQVSAKLDENHALGVATHALVDGRMTDTLHTLLDSLKGQLVLIRSQPQTPESETAAGAMELRIQALVDLLSRRGLTESAFAAARDQQAEEDANSKPPQS